MIYIEMPTWYATVLLVLCVLSFVFLVIGNILATFMTKNYELVVKEKENKNDKD